MFKSVQNIVQKQNQKEKIKRECCGIKRILPFTLTLMYVSVCVCMYAHKTSVII